MSTELVKESIRFPKKYLDDPDLKEFFDDELDFMAHEEDESGIIIFWDDNNPDDVNTSFYDVIQYMESRRLPFDCWIPEDYSYSKFFYRPELSDKAFQLSDDEELMIPASALKNLDKGNGNYEDLGYKFAEFLDKVVPDLPPIESYV